MPVLELDAPAFFVVVCVPEWKVTLRNTMLVQVGASWEGMKNFFFFDSLISPGGGSNDDSSNQEPELVGSS